VQLLQTFQHSRCWYSERYLDSLAERWCCKLVWFYYSVTVVIFSFVVILGHIACNQSQMWPIATDVAHSMVCLCLSVRLLSTWMSCAKTAEPIKMLFGGLLMWVRGTMYCIGWSPGPQWEGALLREHVPAYCNIPMQGKYACQVRVTDAFTTMRGDKMVMWPFATLLWTLVDCSWIVVVCSNTGCYSLYFSDKFLAVSEQHVCVLVKYCYLTKESILIKTESYIISLYIMF